MSNSDNSVTISTGFSSGVTWDLSVDGGISYIQNGLTNSSYTYSQLSPNTTYQIVRRMHGKNGFVEVLPAVTITTVGITMTPPAPIYVSPAPEYAPIVIEIPVDVPIVDVFGGGFSSGGGSNSGASNGLTHLTHVAQN